MSLTIWKDVPKVLSDQGMPTGIILARTMPVTSSRAIKISSGEHFHAG